MVLFTTHHQDARLQVHTVALLDPEDKGSAIFKTLELQNSVTSKNTLIFYHHDARIKDTVNWACSKSHKKNPIQNPVHSNTQINKYPKNRCRQEGPKDQLLHWKRNWPAHGAKLINLCITFSVTESTVEQSPLKMSMARTSQLLNFVSY